MARRRKGGRRIKRTTQKNTDTDQQTTEVPPRCFVFTKGKVPAKLKALVEDLKRVMAPNTSQALKAQKKNKLRDFVAVAGSLNVSFFLILSSTEKHSYLRLVRTPRGPTLTFRISGYSLSSDLAASQRKPYSPGHAIFQCAPTLILSNFDKEKQHEALSSTMLQNLFPTLNVATARLTTFRRVVLVHQLPEEEGGGAELRHYVIKAAPTGVSKGVKKLVRSSKLPSLGRYGDVADFLTGGGGMTSDSGGETDDEEKADLPQDYVGRNAKKDQKVSIKLREIGPRLSLSLLKVEEGLCDGATLYHSLVTKTEEEAAETAARIEARATLKAERKATQAANVERKQQAAKEKLERKRRRRDPSSREGSDAADDEDDDEEDDDGSDGGDGGDGSGSGSDDDDDASVEEEDDDKDDDDEEDEEDDEEDELEGNDDDLEFEDEDEDYAYGDGDGQFRTDDGVDDAEWYRREVGEEPGEELGLSRGSTRAKKARDAAGGGGSGGGGGRGEREAAAGSKRPSGASAAKASAAKKKKKKQRRS
jgi:ribosome biogenesis protein SSF1/2